MARAVREHSLADEAVTLINGDVIFVAKARDRDIDLGPDLTLAICGNAGLGELDGPARVCVLLRGLGRFVGPDFISRLARDVLP